ncbi:hypothetical protein EJF36_10240 [Bacillus sp. HMF5848]|uniref:hypothetical protein n=1 Tax=Bacillus sp. HMF5848 TaxID=2495421 RepID=UPI000F778940|nr:hypothetical protein [Bacillus sp. HMF5848]RSK27230.1 hypothetical protein EJF36_10240 [Bacillus sp. HMF5848]
MSKSFNVQKRGVSVALVFMLIIGFVYPYNLASAGTQIHLHITGGTLDEESTVTLVYDDDKTITMKRQNDELYKAGKPKNFDGSLDVFFRVEDEDEDEETYEPIKMTGKKGTINYWVNVEKDDDNEDEDEDEDGDDEGDEGDDDRDTTTFTLNEPLTPFVNKVFKNTDGTFTAYWGYNNENDIVVDAKTSKISGYYFNELNAMKDNFQEGRNNNAFQTIFIGNSITWALTGPDGDTRYATAYTNNAESYQSLVPTVTAVYDNQDGTYTAYWGFDNNNTVTVNALESKLEGNVIETDEPIKEYFLSGMQVEAFKTTFTGTYVRWKVKGPDGVLRTATAKANDARDYRSLIPEVTAVYKHDNGSVQVYWGYDNNNLGTVSATTSTFSGGYVLNNAKPMKNNFTSGEVKEAFTTRFFNSELTWRLQGPDGVYRYATAYSSQAKNYTSVVPYVDSVIKNNNGTYTAVWGYYNTNNVTVSVSVSTLEGTILKGEVAKQEGFLPGRQREVFETTFKGESTSWTIKGPDGNSRTVTAYANDAE